MATMLQLRNYIDGRWVDAASGDTFETDNPYTGRPWALIPRCTAEDVDRAVAAAGNLLQAPMARAARQGWRVFSGSRSGATLAGPGSR